LVLALQVILVVLDRSIHRHKPSTIPASRVISMQDCEEKKRLDTRLLGTRKE
jgi:hypothetical protein